MPFNSTQLAVGSNYTLATYEKKKPIDQVNVQHVLLDWLLKNKKPTVFGNGSFKEPVYKSNDANYQNYFGADQVSYNERDPARWTDFTWANFHDGFWFDEDRLAANGIVMTDDGNAVPTDAEKVQLIDLLETSYDALRNGIQEYLAYETYRNGSIAKTAPGMQHVVQKLAVDWATNGNTVGGINSATTAYWRNNVTTGISAANVIIELEKSYRAAMMYGGKPWDFIVADAAFIDNYRAQSIAQVTRTVNDGGLRKGGVTLDPSVTDLSFRGIPIVWDPTLDLLGTLDGDATLTKTAYGVNAENLTFRPMKGHWMVNRKPERLPDRYVHYFARTGKYALTTNRRNALSVLAIS